MNETNQKKMVALLGVSNALINYMEDIRHEEPHLIRLSLKKAFNDTIRESEVLHAKIFVGLQGTDRHDVADQINKITLSFEEWVDNHFN
jgi:DNA-binding transcriptional regulator YdaS (Cro superfamily)